MDKGEIKQTALEKLNNYNILEKLSNQGKLCF